MEGLPEMTEVDGDAQREDMRARYAVHHSQIGKEEADGDGPGDGENDGSGGDDPKPDKSDPSSPKPKGPSPKARGARVLSLERER